MPVLDMEFVKSLITYTEENAELIAKEVDEEFHHTKDFYRAVLRRDLRKYLDRVPVHYEWAPDDCPYDHSGILEEKGRIDMNQTVSDFLENEYTGNWTPSYTSGCGKYYDRYGDDFSYDCLIRLQKSVRKENLLHWLFCFGGNRVDVRIFVKCNRYLGNREVEGFPIFRKI